MEPKIYVILAIFCVVMTAFAVWSYRVTERRHQQRIWIHKKTGTAYFIVGRALNCTNAQDGQELILYRRYDDFGNPTPFARERNEFLEKFERKAAGRD